MVQVAERLGKRVTWSPHMRQERRARPDAIFDVDVMFAGRHVSPACFCGVTYYAESYGSGRVEERTGP